MNGVCEAVATKQKRRGRTRPLATANPKRRGELLLLFLLAAAELLELGEHGRDVEIAARLLLGFRGGGGFLGLLARGGLRRRQQRRAGLDRGRLLLVGTLHLE